MFCRRNGPSLNLVYGFEIAPALVAEDGAGLTVHCQFFANERLLEGNSDEAHVEEDESWPGVTRRVEPMP